MKKLTFILAAVLLTTGAFAQKGFYYGVKAGLNLSQISGISDWYDGAPFEAKHQMYADFYAGAFAEYRFGRVIGLQLEAVYSRQGDAMKLSGDGLTTGISKVKLAEKLDYINIPLLIKIYPLEKLSIDFGPQFGFVTKAKYMWKEVYEDDSVDKGTENIGSDNYEKFAFSIAMGVSYQITDMLEVSARYNLGLTKVFSDDYARDISAKNNVIQIGMGVRF